MILRLTLLVYFYLRVNKLSQFSKYQKNYFLQNRFFKMVPKIPGTRQKAYFLYWRLNTAPYLWEGPLLKQLLQKNQVFFSYTDAQQHCNFNNVYLNQKLGAIYYPLFSITARIIFMKLKRILRQKQKKASFIGAMREKNLEQTDFVQGYYNRRVHGFLRFAKKQYKSMYLQVKQKFPFWNNYWMFNPMHSKALWILYNSGRKHYKWLRLKRKFKQRQREAYYRRTFFFPKLDVYKLWMDSTKYYIPRRLSRVSSQSLLLRRIKRARLVSRDFNIFSGFSFSGLRRGAIRGFFTSPKFLFYLRSYFCLFVKRKKNNFYLTVTNGLGEVKLFFSSGSYLIRLNDGRRNKKLRASFRHFVEVLKVFANKLKRKKIFSIKYFMRPLFMRKKHVASLVYTLTGRSIAIRNIINMPKRRHSYAKKTKKARRL